MYQPGSKARVLMVHKERLPDGKGYSIEVSEPLEGVPSDDPEADAREINRRLEEMIRRRPGQYLWLHRRFKNRPEGEPTLY